MAAERWLRQSGRLMVGLALAVLVVAYAAMSLEHGTPLLWNKVVHEDGRRTLAQTLLYYEHATRELPLDLLLGLAIGTGAAVALGSPREEAARTRGERPVIPVLAGLVISVLVIILATIGQLGLGALWANLLQFHTRAEAPLEWGAHWRYHLLERGPLILLALGLWTGLAAFRECAGGGRREVTAWSVLAVFLAATVLFTPTMAALAQPFTDARYLGHQVREIFTHGLVTFPLALGLVLLWWRGDPRLTARRGARLGWALAAVVLAMTTFIYVLVAAIRADAASQGQSESLVTLLAPHFFEHGFSYLVTPLTAVLAFEALRD